MNENNQNLRDQILKTIKSGRVKMRPRWHFILKAALFATGGAILLLTLLYLASFTLFVLRQTGVWFIPVHDLHEWFSLLFSIPWALVLLLVIFIVLFEILVRHYSFAYRQPLIYSAIGIITVVAVGGFLISNTHLHKTLFRYARENRLPFAGQIYRGFGLHKFPGINRGTVFGITSGGFILQDLSGNTSTVVINSSTRADSVDKGDEVVVFGRRQGNFIQAKGVRKVNEEDLDYSPSGKL